VIHVIRLPAEKRISSNRKRYGFSFFAMMAQKSDQPLHKNVNTEKQPSNNVTK